MAHFDQIGSGFPSGQNIIVIHIDGLIGIVVCFSDQDIEKSLFAEVFDDRIVFSGVKDNKTFCLAASRHGPDSIKNFFFIFSCNNCINILLLIAELADAADCFQIK